MSYGLIDDGLWRNAKVRGFTDAEFRLWMSSISFCREHKQTRGFISAADVALVASAHRLRRAKAITDGLVAKGGFEPTASGFQIHDYSRIYSKDEVIGEKRAVAGHIGGVQNRTRVWRKSAFGEALIARDGGFCRYCDQPIDLDESRNGPLAFSFDHVDPQGDNSAENVVSAHLGCNSALVGNTVAEKQAMLRPPRGEANALANRKQMPLSRAGARQDPSPSPSPVPTNVASPYGDAAAQLKTLRRQVFALWAARQGWSSWNGHRDDAVRITQWLRDKPYPIAFWEHVIHEVPDDTRTFARLTTPAAPGEICWLEEQYLGWWNAGEAREKAERRQMTSAIVVPLRAML